MFSGQTLKQISQKISGLFEYTNFSEKWPEKEEKTISPMENIKQAVEDFQRDLKQLAPPESTEEESEKEEKTEEFDEEFTSETLM